MTRLFFTGYPPFVVACAQMLASLIARGPGGAAV